MPRFLWEPTVHSQFQPSDISVNNLYLVNIISYLFKILFNIMSPSVSTFTYWSFPLKHLSKLTYEFLIILYILLGIVCHFTNSVMLAEGYKVRIHYSAPACRPRLLFLSDSLKLSYLQQ